MVRYSARPLRFRLIKYILQISLGLLIFATLPATSQGLQFAVAPTIEASTTNSSYSTSTVLQIETDPVIKPTTLADKVEHYAQKWGVSSAVMWKVIKCENRELDPKLQSRHRYPKDYPKWGVVAGEFEKSFGLVMIHLPSWPGVSYEQATDVDFSLNFLAEKLSHGQGYLWTCYRMNYPQ